LKPLIFLGSSSGIQLYVDTAQRQGLNVAGIIDSDYYGNTEIFENIPVIGTETELETWKDDYCFFIATNSSPDPGHDRDVQKRKKLISLVEKYNLDCINLIDPDCCISSHACLGKGIYIGYNCYIEHGANIGDFCQIFYDAGISHDVKIGKNTVIQRKCGIGNVTIGDNVYIGMWVNIFCTKHIVIGDNAIINQGLSIMRDVMPDEHVKLTKDAVRIYKNLIQIE